MNISCDIVQDLLPLYHDGVCSRGSIGLIEEHLAGCDACRDEMLKMNSDTLDRRIQKERNDVVSHHALAIRRKSLVVGTGIALIMTIPILVCLIVNLATGHTLDWFFIVLTALMTLASVTVVPLTMEERKGLWALGCFFGSLVLLLLTICLYSGGDWFFIAIVPVIFGLSVVFAPFVAGQLPLKGFISQNKGLLAMFVDTALLYVMMVTIGLHGSGAGFWPFALPLTTVCLIFPWVLFLIIRYLRANALVRGGLCIFFGGVFLSFIGDFINAILFRIFRISFLSANFGVWNNYVIINANVYLLVLLTGCVLGCVLLSVGLSKTKKTLLEKSDYK